MAFELLAIGEAMAEIRQDMDTDFAVSYAGDTYNTAIYCSRGCKASDSVAYMTRVGTDPLSQSFAARALAEGLNTDFIDVDKNRNIGIYAVATDATGERSFSYWRKDSAARGLFSELPITLPSTRIIYLSGITLAILPQPVREALIKKLGEISASGESLVAFDSNYRPALWESADTARDAISTMWGVANIALPSIDDEMALFEEDDEESVINRFAAKSWTACAIKRSARGPVSTTLPQSEHPSFEPAETVIDTTGAGDSFNGAYLAAFLNGESEEQCLISGHTKASQVVGVRGAIMPIS